MSGLDKVKPQGFALRRWRMAHADDVPMDSQSMDYAEHERTYRLFLGLTKWISISVAVILTLMAIFLV